MVHVQVAEDDVDAPVSVEPEAELTQPTPSIEYHRPSSGGLDFDGGRVAAVADGVGPGRAD